MTFGEIYLCQFVLTSGAGGKVRPALVLFDLDDDAIICRITSVSRSGTLDVALTDWESAGLLKPSVVRLGKIVTAEKAILFRRLGVLGRTDAEAVRNVWNRMMQL